MRKPVHYRAVLATAAALLALTGCGEGISTLSTQSGGNTTPPTQATNGEWTWTSGANSKNQYSSYGAQGTASPENTPGARVNQSSATNSSGTFWLFGGYGGAASGLFGDLNDLWRYSNGQWTWVSGSDATEQAGTYGTKGVASPNNVPGARYDAVGWTDPQGNFWLFGGLGIDSTGARGSLNDLWRYSNGQWTWMSGSNLSTTPGFVLGRPPGIYGTKGIPGSANTPGARVDASSWSDSAGNLWLFGGTGIDSTGRVDVLNDLWKFSDGEWTWMAGDDVAPVNGQLGAYGVQGTAAPGNAPGARFGALTWTDQLGELWLFGGQGNDATGACWTTPPYICYLNDLWKYSAGEWSWMGGSNVANVPGTYGSQGVAAAGDAPGARWGSVVWADGAGNAWLFGGNGFDSAPAASFEFGGLNDLWKYSGGQWTWMGGSNMINQPGSYGTRGVAAPGNIPGQRYNAAGWTDSSGNLWLFGGGIYQSGGGSFNDLWEYQP